MSREELFPITPFPQKTTTGQKMVVFSCGDVFVNSICNDLKQTMCKLDALEDYLIECEASEMVHAVNPGIFETMFDLIQTCNAIYENCCDKIDNIDKTV